MNPQRKVLTLFGTRPEAIKLAPVLRKLQTLGDGLKTVNVTSAQHTDLLYAQTSFLRIRIDHDLRVMRPNQKPNQVCSRILSALDDVLVAENPDLMLVQGDTSTALAGALAAFHLDIPVAHIEAGLRSGNSRNPFPEEMNRQLITRLATYHFAATRNNRATLLAEGVHPNAVFVTGNPVIDSLREILKGNTASTTVSELIRETCDLKRLVLTTHRRESFGHVVGRNLKDIRTFVESHQDVALIFPVHPNPEVAGPAARILGGHPRIKLIKPLNYEDFIILLSNAWLIVSDSGGLQEEAPTLGKPLLVIRENTERPEALETGIARLVGSRPESLLQMLEEAYQPGSWTSKVKKMKNPFGAGDSGDKIARIVAAIVNKERGRPRPSSKSSCSSKNKSMNVATHYLVALSK